MGKKDKGDTLPQKVIKWIEESMNRPFFNCFFWATVFLVLYLVSKGPCHELPKAVKPRTVIAVLASGRDVMGPLGKEVLDTWVKRARQKGFIVVFFGSNEDSSLPLVKVTDTDEWDALSNTTLSLFKWLWERYGDQGNAAYYGELPKDYFIKVDLDSYVAVDNLIAAIPRIHEVEMEYFGFCGLFPSAGINMCGGSGYGLSRHALRKLVRRMDKCELFGFNEDETVAKCLAPGGITGIDVEGFAPKETGDDREPLPNQIIFHKVEAGQLTTLHETWGKPQKSA